MDSEALRDTRIEGLSDDLAVPRKNGEIQFQAPWEARVFGMAVAMYDDRQFAWDDFRTRLVQEIADAELHCDDSGYYERWLGSFERLLLETGVLSPEELDSRTAEFATGVWDPHEHYETTSDATASSVRTHLRSDQRNVVWRSDGEAINVFRRPGQLFVCATGCCCGRTERGHFPVPVDLYHQEWARRRIRHKVHLSLGGCLGPCALSNVALLLYAGEQIWFHSIETDEHVIAIFDYIESMVRENAVLPPPETLSDRVFDVFDWSRDPTSTDTLPIVAESVSALP